MNSKAGEGRDPFLGCPFDQSEMYLAETAGFRRLGDHVEFRERQETVRGVIIAIGENAKHEDGCPFTALAIKSGNRIYIKTGQELGGI
jgi:hypothetical protein